MLVQGTRTPDLVAKPVFGRTFDLARAPGPVGVVFLRHAGSAVTRAALAALDRAWDDVDRAGASLVAVVEGSARAAFDVVPRLHVRFPVIHDGDGQHYERFAVGRDAGLVRTLADPRSAARWLRTLAAAGHGEPGGPLDRRCAAYVVRDGAITWAWEATTIAEGPPVDALAAELTARR